MLNTSFSSGSVLADQRTWACSAAHMFIYSMAIFTHICTLIHEEIHAVSRQCVAGRADGPRPGRAGNPRGKADAGRHAGNAAVPVPRPARKHAAGSACCWPRLHRHPLRRRRALAASALGGAPGRGGLLNRALEAICSLFILSEHLNYQRMLHGHVGVSQTLVQAARR